ncbi:precorrin-2 dehydrogenase/sirohydrochlorin ferrochelatase family protein [Limosilactobacillus reuteri]|uniref:precorrin-2 dehydrogenase/sirohydrochlorin ferrochelatase family protein n=1 Tax=Limosilactobacillus reuteri TaxID=1598 RepID=UPI001E44F619|nr:bifunctional precorrin-2 dehydrogenase/sirohydrochlorin ferrochelatase [Limosilactobacillus reuteri]MCC4380362.1 bifunctional precorrin-2 dehydrogenase/sirohydrochlorin ferrochelatase [Limosilactobacillus reuteri]
MQSPYPVILNLADKNVAVVGGGKVACRKINKLLAAGVRPTVISPLLSPEIQPIQINWIPDKYQRKYVENMDIIITCTDDRAVNDQVKKEATHFQLVNNTSDKTNSDFYNLATIKANDMFISVSTMGKSPSMAKKMKNEIKEWIKQKFHKEFE